MAIDANSGALRVERLPLNAPIGVLTAETMKTSLPIFPFTGIIVSSSIYITDCFPPSFRASIFLK